MRPPGDKSISHRAVLLAPLARSNSVVTGLSGGGDVRSSISAMVRLGAEIAREDEPGGGITIRVTGGRPLAKAPGPVDCGNSGTTARLLAGILAGSGLGAVLDGDASLRRRPMRRIVYPLQAMGAKIEYVDQPERLPIRVLARATGTLRTLRHRPRVASAQVKSALLLAGLTGRVRVEISEPAASRDHTERMLAAMGAPVEFDPDRRGAGGVRFDPDGWDGVLGGLDLAVPGDPSSAAYLIGAALLRGRPIEIENVGANPTRVAFLEVLAEMGAGIQRERAPDRAGEPVETWAVTPPDELRPFSVGGERIPGLIDEIPLLAVLAARADGRSEIRDARELRVKESDRLAGLADNLNALGVSVTETSDGLVIQGGRDRLSGTVRTRGDHRLAMAFGVLDVAADSDLRIDDPACVAVSFPGFWAALEPFRADDSSGGAPVRVPGPAPAREAAEPGPGEPSHHVIAIDGPAASGKSTTARSVADRIGFAHLNSGLFYRAITWWALDRGLDESSETFAAEVRRLPIDLASTADGLTVEVDGARPGAELHTGDVTALVSAVSTVPVVREVVLDRLRGAARRYDLVCDGRDIGTTVFPGARLKVYLVADPPERARRRLIEDDLPLTQDTIDREADRLMARDDADASRTLSPLRRAEDAIEIDTTNVPPEEVVGAIVSLAVERGLAESG